MAHSWVTKCGVLLAAVALLPTGARAPAAKTEDGKTLYALGLAVGKSLGGFSLSSAELEIVKRGLTDAVTGAKTQVDLEQYKTRFDELARTRAEASSRTYLDKAQKEKGAQVQPSGLVYS